MLNTFLLKKKGFTDEEIAEAIMSVDLAEKPDCLSPAAGIKYETRLDAITFIEEHKQKCPMSNERAVLKDAAPKQATRGLHLGHRYRCSNCGALAYMENYCSNCGAKVIQEDIK